MLLAMSLGPPLEVIIPFFIVILTISAFVILTIFRFFFKKLTFKRIALISIGTPVIIILSTLIIEKVIDFVKSPMTIRKYNIEGDYVINRGLFSGKNCDWQFEHYTLRIYKDTLYLKVFNNRKLVNIYKRPIFYTDRGKHTFFEFYNSRQIDFDTQQVIDKYNFDYIADKYMDNMNPDQTFIMEKIEHETDSIRSILYDSIVTVKTDSVVRYADHHMLRLNPLLHADPFSFNIVLQSTKYGNVFFTKGNWAEE